MKSKIPIVFIHGVLGSKYNFQNFEKYFSNIYSFDLIGFGAEEKPKATYDVDFFLAFLEKKITSPCILVGHSMGAVLAKNFALRHPALVKKLYFINYPINARKNLEKAVRKDLLMSMYIDGRLFTKLLCNTKIVYRILFSPFVFLFYRKHFASFWNGLSHTYNSASSTINEVVFKDDYQTLFNLRKKPIFITGEKDYYSNPDLLKQFQNFWIPGMEHRFFSHEKEIAKIIQNTSS